MPTNKTAYTREWKKKQGPEYNVWSAMKDRCLNPNCSHYKNYGGRGITVCDRWLRYANFIADMGHRPSSKYTLERIDNDGNYEPQNCRWVTRGAQARNMRSNVLIEHNGKKQCLMDWSKETGISYFTLRSRIRYGVPLFGPVIYCRERLRDEKGRLLHG